MLPACLIRFPSAEDSVLCRSSNNCELREPTLPIAIRERMDQFKTCHPGIHLHHQLRTGVEKKAIRRSQQRGMWTMNALLSALIVNSTSKTKCRCLLPATYPVGTSHSSESLNIYSFTGAPDLLPPE